MQRYDLADELRRADMARALRWLPTAELDCEHLRRNSYRLFSLQSPEFCEAHDAAALHIERMRRQCFPTLESLSWPTQSQSSQFGLASVS